MPYIAGFLIGLTILVGGLTAFNNATLEQVAIVSSFLHFSKPQFGTSLTTVTSATKISDLATILPANFNALNNGKIENSSSSIAAITTLLNLTSVGTIGTGVWNGTAIAVNKGGSGTTSPSIWQVVLGNGANGFTVASSTGVSGQFLTSNGPGKFPTWQTSSVNQSDSYTWTGTYHNYLGETYFKYLNASSTLNLNGIDLSFPSTQGASSTVLMNNGSGGLTWNKMIPLRYTTASFTGVSCATNSCNATTSLALTIPANTMGASSTIDVYAGILTDADAAAATCQFSVRDSTGALLGQSTLGWSDGAAWYGAFHTLIVNDNSVSSQKSITYDSYSNSNSHAQSATVETSSSVNTLAATSLYLTVASGAANTQFCTIDNFSIVVNP